MERMGKMCSIRVFALFQVVIVFLFQTSVSAGESDSSSMKELEKMVVTGSKTERPMENLPASVSAISGQEIERLDVKNVDEALKYEQGIYNKRSKGLMESMAGVVMRGFAGTDQVLILLDGQPINNGYVGRPQFNNIPVEDVQKIEVARGPFSSLYGGNAMGGVVNIITRTPTGPRLKFRGGLGGGSNTGLANNIFVGYEDAPIKDKLGVSLSFSQKRDEGYVTNDLVKTAKAGATGTMVTGVIPTTDRYGKTTFQYGEGGGNGAENRALGGKLSWNIDHTHSLKTGCYLTWYNYWNNTGKSFLEDAQGTIRDTGAVRFAYNDTTYTFRVDQRNFLDGDGKQGILYYTLSYRGDLSENVILTAGAGVTHQFENWYTSVGSTSATTRAGGPGKLSSTPNTKGNFDIQAEIRNLIPMNSILAGLSIEGARAETEEYNLKDWERYEDRDTLMYKSGGKTGNGGFFINDEFTILKTDGLVKNLIFNAGLRVDYWRTMAGINHDYVSGKVDNSYDDRSKTSVSPRGGLTLNLASGSLYNPTFWVAGGKAFRPPTVYDLYRTWLSSTGTLNESNPDLRPETMWSGEFGTTQRFLQNRLTLNATGYYNTLTDMIYSTTIAGETTPSGGEISRKMNIGKARIQGVETGLTLSPVKHVSLFANYAFTDAYILKLDEFPDYVYKYLTLVPRHTTGFGILADFGRVNGRIGSRYVSKRYTNDENTDTTSGVYGSRDAYFITDLGITFRPAARFAVTLGIDNLFNYEYYDYYRSPGRTFSGDVKLEF